MKENNSEYSNESLELLKKEVFSLKNHISRLLKSHFSDVKADIYYQNILKNKVFSDEYEFPVSTVTSWSVALELGCWLYDTIINQRPKIVVEFGSGLSTLIMAIALSRSSGGKLIAVEHDAEYFKKTSDLLRDADLLDKVELLLCPLVDVEVHGTTYKWYALTDAVLKNYLKDEKVDLLFVDGPPAASGPKTRFPAYSLTKEFLSENVLIVLDDLDRPDEMEIANSWVEESDGKLVVQRVLAVRHGAVVLTADQEWESTQKSILSADVQSNDIDASTPFTGELVSLMRNRQISRDLAVNLIMRHELYVEKELNKRQTDLLEQSSVMSLVRLNMALAVSGLTVLDKVLSTAEKRECTLISNSEKSHEAINFRLNGSEEFTLRDLVIELDNTQQYILQLNDRFSDYVKCSLGERNELKESINVLENKNRDLENEFELLEKEKKDQLVNFSEKEKLLNKISLENESLREENEVLAIQLNKIKEERNTVFESLNSSRKECGIKAIELEEAKDKLEELENLRLDYFATLKKLKDFKRKCNNQADELTLLKSSIGKKNKLLAARDIEAESKLREIYNVSRQFQSESYKYASLAVVESERAEKVKKHLSYRLGAAMIKNSESIQGWLLMPWALRDAYKEYREYRNFGDLTGKKDEKYQTISLNGKSVVSALELKWHDFYIDVNNEVSKIKISIIATKRNASVGLEYSLIDELNSNLDTVRTLEISDSKSAFLFEVESKTAKILRVRKFRGVPAWLRIERVKSDQINTTNKEVPSLTADSSIVGVISTSIEKSTDIDKKVILNSSLTAKQTFVKKDAVVAKRYPEEKRTVLLEAHALIESGDVARGFEFAKENANEDEMHGIAILEANQALHSDEKWLDAVNRYISRLGVAPVELKIGNEDRFFRFTTQALPPIEGGPLVSVIMPAYNCASTLEFAANSILQQQWRNLELIIVDDCSADDTWQVMRGIAIRDPRVRILRNSVNCGPYVSKNRAVDIARGEYITGHDSDDWAHPERLARHMNAVQLDDKPVYASAIKMIRLRSNGKFERISATTVNTFDGVMQTAFISTLFNTEFLRTKLGHWDCARFGADSEIISRCQALLGDRFIIYEQLGMLCLDSDEGLTAHPVHGTRGRTAPSRKHYKKAFLAWHEELKNKGESYVLPFPHFPRKFPAPKAVTVSNGDLQRIAREDKSGRSFDLDVCIITDLRYPGGTASSTLDELHTCVSQGLSVRVFHCPTKLSIGKPISSRYYQNVEHIEVQDFDISAIRTKVLIVRHPMVICSDAYASLSKRIQAESIVYVINNSRYRANGEDAFDLMHLRTALTLLQASKQAKVYPLGPRIRKELESESLPITLASEDWHPLFDSSYYSFQPKNRFSSPIVIGRHGRDQIDKWPASKNELLTVYPENKNVHLKVLGGASIVKKLLGRIPSNWTVLPFGAVEPPEFLNTLDVFVYFPSEGLNEAFGRTVMEAIFSGVPCVLPESFRSSFGDLAFYSDINNVQAVISRLSEKDDLRIEFVSMARKIALERFDSKVLRKRLSEIASLEFSGDDGEIDQINNSSWNDLLAYKKWVEFGYK